MTSDKIIEFGSAEALPSLELLSQQYELMEKAIRTKLVESFLVINRDVMPVVCELAKLLDMSLRKSKSSSAYLEAFSNAQSIQELTKDIEKLMSCYHRIIVGRDWMQESPPSGTGPTLIKS